MNIFLCLFFEAIHLQSEPVCLVKPRLFAEKKHHNSPFNTLYRYIIRKAKSVY